MQVLQGLTHVNIVQFLGHEGPDSHSIVMEYVPGGSLHDLLQMFGALEEPVLRAYSRQLLDGLSYLHVKGIIHG